MHTCYNPLELTGPWISIDNNSAQGTMEINFYTLKPNYGILELKAS